MSYYLNRTTWALVPDPPGIRIPVLVALAVAALLGLAFVVFLPAAGLWLTARALLGDASPPSVKPPRSE